MPSSFDETLSLECTEYYIRTGKNCPRLTTGCIQTETTSYLNKLYLVATSSPSRPNLNMTDAVTTIHVQKVVVQLPSLDKLAPIHFKLLVYVFQSSLLVMSALMVFVLLKNLLLRYVMLLKYAQFKCVNVWLCLRHVHVIYTMGLYWAILQNV